jgi:hypothetical protein
MDYKAVLKQKNESIAELRSAIALNKILSKDSAAILSALKPQIREANRNGGGKMVSTLTKEQNLRRSLVTTITEVNEIDRQTLRETYTLRRALITEWVASEEA